MKVTLAEPSRPGKRPPDELEAGAIEAAEKWGAEQAPPPKITWVDGGGVAVEHDDLGGEFARVMRTFGTRSEHFAGSALHEVERVTRDRGRQAQTQSTNTNAGVAMIAAIAPADELEAAMGVQMVAAHTLAAELWGKAKHAETADHLALYGNLAVKASRTFGAMAESLAKLRAGGKQRVEVVYVDQRQQGQIVNYPPPPGGGGPQLLATQSHAQPAALPYAPGAAVWSADPGRERMPVAGCSRSETLQDARRDEPGSADRGGERPLSNGDAHK